MLEESEHDQLFMVNCSWPIMSLIAMAIAILVRYMTTLCCEKGLFSLIERERERESKGSTWTKCDERLLWMLLFGAHAHIGAIVISPDLHISGWQAVPRLNSLCVFVCVSWQLSKGNLVLFL